jgi:hypothetical protein
LAGSKYKQETATLVNKELVDDSLKVGAKSRMSKTFQFPSGNLSGHSPTTHPPDPLGKGLAIYFVMLLVAEDVEEKPETKNTTQSSHRLHQHLTSVNRTMIVP